MRTVTRLGRFGVALALAGCGTPGQEFRAGMELVCSAGEQPEVTRRAPAERAAAMSAWIRARVTNADARAVFAAVADANPAERARVLVDAAQRAGIARCALATMPAALGMDLVDAPANAVLAEVPGGAVLAITDDALVLDGRLIVAVRDGQIDPAEVEGGARGLLVPKLTAFAGKLAEVAPGPLAIAATPATPYRLVLMAVRSVGTSHPTIGLLVRGRDGDGAIPLTLPSKARPEAAVVGQPGAAGPVRMAMMIDPGRVVLFSFDGREGSIGQPLAQAAISDVEAAATMVATTLAAVADRHPAGTDARQLVVIAGPSQPVATILPLMAAARASFPDLLLSAGFE